MIAFIQSFFAPPPSLAPPEMELVNTAWKETELFPAVRMNDIKKIISYSKKKEANIHAVDFMERNALVAALKRCVLKAEACRALIRLGFQLDRVDIRKNTPLATLVYFYKHLSLFRSDEDNRRELELFRCMVEGGADLDVTYQAIGHESESIREKIRTHPEMEAIVQEVRIKTANQVFAALQSEPTLARVVCEMIEQDPGPNWKPSLEKTPNNRRYFRWIAGASLAAIAAIYLKVIKNR